MILTPGAPDLSNVAKIDHDVIPFTLSCQRNGICVDREWFWELSSFLQQEMKEKAREIINYIPQSMMDSFTSESMSVDDFNPDSSDQIAKLLFQHLRIGSDKELSTTKSGNRISTGKKQLERLRDDHPVVALILQRREYAKLENTYCKALPAETKYIPEIDRWKFFFRIGLTFTSTGRMTVSRMHQIPIRTELGRLIRYGFIPEPGCIFVSADYGGLELRVLSHCAQERTMIEVFNDPKGDIHQKTQDGLHMPDSMDKIAKRLAAKRVNFGLCLRTGQRLLTNVGLVPIEKLTLNMLLWDGVAWVQHGGVVFNGYQEVIEWDGVAATPEHEVWTECGQVLPIAEAMAGGRRIATTAIEEAPVRYVADYWERDRAESWSRSNHGNMQPVRHREGAICYGLIKWQDARVRLRSRAAISWRSSGTTDQVADGPLPYDSPTLFESGQRHVRELWRAWNKEQVQDLSRICLLRAGESSTSYLQEDLYRQNRQQRALHSRELEAIDVCGKSSKYSSERVDQLQRQEDSGDRSISELGEGLSWIWPQPMPNYGTRTQGISLERYFETEAEEEMGKEGLVPVYDVLNAGPRHRFTCEGKLVSNCYGTTDLGLWLTLQADGVPCTREQCAEFQRQFFLTYPDVMPYIERQWYRARRYGFVYNIFGRISLAPEFRSVHKRIVREGERRIQNFGIQSTATDVFKIGAAHINDLCAEVRAGLLGKPYRCDPILPIHDQCIISTDIEAAPEVAELVKIVMEEAVKLRIPLRVDADIQARWVK